MDPEMAGVIRHFITMTAFVTMVFIYLRSDRRQ